MCLDDDAIARYLQDQHDTNETQPLTPHIIGEPISTEPEPNYPEPNDVKSTESQSLLHETANGKLGDLPSKVKNLNFLIVVT